MATRLGYQSWVSYFTHNGSALFIGLSWKFFVFYFTDIISIYWALQFWRAVDQPAGTPYSVNESTGIVKYTPGIFPESILTHFNSAGSNVKGTPRMGRPPCIQLSPPKNDASNE